MSPYRPDSDFLPSGRNDQPDSIALPAKKPLLLLGHQPEEPHPAEISQPRLNPVRPPAEKPDLPAKSRRKGLFILGDPASETRTGNLKSAFHNHNDDMTESPEKESPRKTNLHPDHVRMWNEGNLEDVGAPDEPIRLFLEMGRSEFKGAMKAWKERQEHPLLDEMQQNGFQVQEDGIWQNNRRITSNPEGNAEPEQAPAPEKPMRTILGTPTREKPARTPRAAPGASPEDPQVRPLQPSATSQDQATPGSTEEAKPARSQLTQEQDDLFRTALRYEGMEDPDWLREQAAEVFAGEPEKLAVFNRALDQAVPLFRKGLARGRRRPLHEPVMHKAWSELSGLQQTISGRDLDAFEDLEQKTRFRAVSVAPRASENPEEEPEPLTGFAGTNGKLLVVLPTETAKVAVEEPEQMQARLDYLEQLQGPGMGEAEFRQRTEELFRQRTGTRRYRGPGGKLKFQHHYAVPEKTLALLEKLRNDPEKSAIVAPAMGLMLFPEALKTQEQREALIELVLDLAPVTGEIRSAMEGLEHGGKALDSLSDLELLDAAGHSLLALWSFAGALPVVGALGRAGTKAARKAFPHAFELYDAQRQLDHARKVGTRSRDDISTTGRSKGTHTASMGRETLTEKVKTGMRQFFDVGAVRDWDTGPNITKALEEAVGAGPARQGLRDSLRGQLMNIYGQAGEQHAFNLMEKMGLQEARLGNPSTKTGEWSKTINLDKTKNAPNLGIRRYDHIMKGGLKDLDVSLFDLLTGRKKVNDMTAAEKQELIAVEVKTNKWLRDSTKSPQISKDDFVIQNKEAYHAGSKAEIKIDTVEYLQFSLNQIPRDVLIERTRAIISANPKTAAHTEAVIKQMNKYYDAMERKDMLKNITWGMHLEALAATTRAIE